MGLVYEYLTYDGVSSEDFNVHISGDGTYDAPQRDVETISIAGKNGDLHLDNGRFNNIEIRYSAFCVDNFAHNYGAFKAFLTSKRGYKRLEDTYHPEYYRRAAYNDKLTPSMTPRNLAGSFDIVFDCDPRCFLKSGEVEREVVSGGYIKNPTLFDANPLIRAYGSGTLAINDVSVRISTSGTYTDIDCDIQEAYEGSINRNGNISLVSGEFPKLKAGLNSITYTGLSKVIITPNWWTV